MPNLNLYIVVTKDCNLRCRYCPAIKATGEIEYKTIDKIIQIISKSNIEKLFVNFHGGETLLAWKKIVYFVDNIQNINKEKIFAINTNGIELTNNKIQYIKKNHFQVRISCDGYITSHLSYRRKSKDIIAEDVVNYNKIIRNISSLIKANISTKVNMVITPDTVTSLLSNYLFLDKLGVEFINICPAMGMEWNKNSIYNLHTQLEKLKTIYKDTKSYYNPEFFDCISNKIVEIKYFLNEGRKYINCDSFVIDVDGEIYADEFDQKTKKYLRICNVSDIDNFKNIKLDNYYSYFHLIYDKKLFSQTILKSMKLTYKLLLKHYTNLRVRSKDKE